MSKRVSRRFTHARHQHCDFLRGREPLLWKGKTRPRALWGKFGEYTEIPTQMEKLSNAGSIEFYATPTKLKVDSSSRSHFSFLSGRFSAARSSNFLQFCSFWMLFLFHMKGNKMRHEAFNGWNIRSSPNSKQNAFSPWLNHCQTPLVS